MRKLNLLQKIVFSALFMALAVVLSRFVSLPYLFGLPFLKISLAPSIVMFSSIYLGPLWGLLVGTLTDIIGAIFFPQGGAFNPLFTIAASLTGLMPGLIYKLLKDKTDKKFPISMTIILSCLVIFVSATFIFSDNFHSGTGKKVYEIADWLRIAMPILSVVLSFIFVFGSILIKNRFKNKKINKYYNIYTIGTALYGTYFLFKIPVSSLIKCFVLSYNFWFIFVTEMLIGFIACFVHLIIITIALNISTLFNIQGALTYEDLKNGR